MWRRHSGTSTGKPCATYCTFFAENPSQRSGSVEIVIRPI
jgi:hypothetical protein